MKLKLHSQILMGILFGALLGILFREDILFLKPLGDVFIRLLRMVMVPLVFSSIVMGMASLGSIKYLGRLGIRTFVFFLSSNVVAVLLGLLVVNLFNPGKNSHILGTQIAIPETVHQTSFSWSAFFVDMVPNNIFEAMSSDHMLAVIFFAVLAGAAMLVVGRKADPLAKIIDSLNEVMLQVTYWVMKCAPIGVCALMAVLIGRTGFSAFKPLAFYMVTVLMGLSLMMFLVYPFVLLVLSNYSPVLFYKKMFPAIVTAFFTDSSLATLPVTMDCLEKNIGLSSRVTSFVTPLSATANKNGTALYEGVAVVFIAQAFGVDLSLTQQLIILVTASLASMSAAGIPSAGLVTMVVVLRSVNLPLEGIGLILAVDRIVDMFRTTVNVVGGACSALWVARVEGESLDQRMSI